MTTTIRFQGRQTGKTRQGADWLRTQGDTAQRDVTLYEFASGVHHAYDRELRDPNAVLLATGTRIHQGRGKDTRTAWEIRTSDGRKTVRCRSYTSMRQLLAEFAAYQLGHISRLETLTTIAGREVPNPAFKPAATRRQS